jgi:hypothetical protein
MDKAKNLPKILGNINKNYKYLVAIFVVVFGLVFIGSNLNSPSSANQNSAASDQELQEFVEELKQKETSGEVQGIQDAGSEAETDASTQTDLTDRQGVVSEQRNLSDLNYNSQYSSPADRNIQNTTNSVMKGVSNTIMPIASTNSYAMVTNPKDPSQTAYVPVYNQNAITGLMQVTTSMYENKPLSVSAWTDHVQKQIDPTVYASSDDSGTYYPGQGYNLLSPIRSLWSAVARIVYFLYIIVIVVIGILIVFRSQLDGQDSVTLMNAIPSLIVSILLVFFSYPLSAVFIDLITVGSGVVYGALIGTDENSGAPGSFLHEGDIIVNYSAVGANIVHTDTHVIQANKDLQIDDSYMSVWSIFQVAGINPTTEGINSLVPQDYPVIGGVLNNVLSGLSDTIGDPLLGLVFAFAAFSAMVKLFMALIKQYATLMLYPIISPFIFLFAAIPGKTGSMVVGYFSKLLAASLSFIAVYAVFLVMIIVSRDLQNLGDVTWVPPLLGYRAEDYGETNSLVAANLVRPFIGFALFMIAPMIPEYITNLIGAAGEDLFGETIVGGLKGGVSGVVGAGKTIDGLVKDQLGIKEPER